MEIFTEVDMTKGKVSSEYPISYYPQVLEDLKEEVRREEYNIENGLLNEKNLPSARARVKGLREKIEKIEAANPALTTQDKDTLNAIRKELGKDISASMYTRSQMQKGIVNVHDEARRMSEPCIKVDGKAAEFASKVGVKVIDGKVSRTGAEKIWKIASSKLGEFSNTEVLRRD